MQIYQHRINTIEQLRAVSTNLGVEIDVRSYGDSLVLSHDPFMHDLTLFDDWLVNYSHNGIIVNIKEEGLEERILDLLATHSVEDYFFLDQSFPFLMRTIRSGELRTAVRVSDFESADTAINLNPIPGWVWLDSFTGNWHHLSEVKNLVAKGYKTCLVSPELQGRNLDEEYGAINDVVRTLGLKLEAVCTKKPEVWMQSS